MAFHLFQSFAMALGGRVGIGNIAGVATAIYFGGPGLSFDVGHSLFRSWSLY